MFRYIALLVLVLTVQSSFAKKKSNLLPDSSRITTNEIGVSMGGFHYSAFAPESYMQGFGFNFSKGIFYKKEIKQYGFRIGMNNSVRAVSHSKSNSYVEANDTFSIAGKIEGSVFFAGIERGLYEKGRFKFYAGIDVAIADKTFKGNYENFNRTESFECKKNMIGIGVNPLLGCSVTVFNNVRISAESTFSNWYISETCNRNYMLPEPKETTATSKRFVSSPNPLNTVSVSVLF